MSEAKTTHIEVLVALITVAGSIAAAAISAVATTKHESDEFTSDIAKKFGHLAGVEVESGQVIGGQGPDWLLDRHVGPRSSPNWDSGPWFRKRVDFKRAFTRPPKVIATISAFEFEKGYNARLVVGAENIDTTGFTLTMHTWGDTRVNEARSSWIAYYQPGR